MVETVKLVKWFVKTRNQTERHFDPITNTDEVLQQDS